MRVLVPVDFSEMAREGLAYGARIASLLDAELIVAHIIDTPRLSGEFDPFLRVEGGAPADVLAEIGDQAASALMSLLDDVGVEASDVRISQGDPAEQIVFLADQLDVHVIVLGTQARKGASRLILGSVTDRVLRLSDKPVLAVPPRALAAHRKAKLGTLLVASDFSTGSKKILAVATALVRASKGSLCVLHAYEDAPPITTYPFALPLDLSESRSQQLRFAEERLSNAVLGVRELGVPATWKLERGEPADMIASAAADVGADLIVMGTHGRRGLNRLLLGSVAETVLRRSACPVLAVPSAALVSRAGAEDDRVSMGRTSQ